MVRAVIVANGIIEDEDGAKALAAGAPLLICADGGAHHVLRWGLLPHAVIGDMDSLDEGTLRRLEDAGVTLLRYPSRKDETDLELALDYAVRQGADEILILGALGGRWDHTVANILLLTWPRLEKCDVQILAGRERLFLVRRHATLRGAAGNIVSLLPLSPVVEGIVTTGLEYPLRGEPLYMGPSRGVSNVMLGPEASVTIESGWLLVVHQQGAGTAS